MKVLLQILGWGIAALLLLQFIQIKVPPAPKAQAADEIQAPKEVMKLLKTSCYDCHSNHTKWPWYSNIAPISWQVHSNVKNGRNWLNFSIWNRYTQKQKQKRYKQTVEALKFKMPPSEYLLIHKDARLTPQQRKVLQDWVQSKIIEDN